MTVDVPFAATAPYVIPRAAPGGNSKRWLLSRIDASRVVTGGASAGGNLAQPLLQRRLHHEERRMNRLIPFVAVLWLLSPTAMAQSNMEFETRVVRVVSGDTVIVERDGSEVELRLADIGAPQGSQFLAPSSRTAVDGMVRNRAVRVQVTGVEEGVRIYGRLFAGRLDVARAQVRQGNAWVCWDYALDSELMPVENEARRHRRGVWRSMMDVTSRSECRQRPPVPPPAEPKAPAKPN